ncbi:hypothetical protein FHR66_001282 [Xanthomonas sp. F4]
MGVALASAAGLARRKWKCLLNALAAPLQPCRGRDNPVATLAASPPTGNAHMIKSLSLLALLGAAALAPQAQAAGNIDCKLSFNLSGWSVLYKTAKGTGTITCNDGAVIPVKISSKGGGLTVGKSKIVGGRGTFSGAYSLNDLFGTYAAAEAHAGLVKSSTAQVVTKGDISLALAGTGEGVDLGVNVGNFVIERRK